MNNSNNQELTFEEAVKAISEKNDDGFKPREQKLEKTAKNDTNDMIL